MEQLLHYVWKHRLFPAAPLATTGGESVEVIDPGLHNDGAGPDFFNAKIRVGTTLWVGNVEIHGRASDWFAHRHDADHAYDNVVLHVVAEADTDAVTASGRRPPQLIMAVPDSVRANYASLLAADRKPPCWQAVASLPALKVHSWMSALQAERLQQKTEAIERRAALAGGSWEKAFFVTLARNFGFGVNSDAFETWAMSVPLEAAAHHRDDPFQIEALFMGQAGLLDAGAASPRRQAGTAGDGYFLRLGREYRFLAHKFGLRPIDPGTWRFMRLRPQNFPYTRLSQLATLYCSRRCSLSIVADCQDAAALRRCLATDTSPYWHSHYTFGHATKPRGRQLSAASADVVIINTVVPVLYAYGRHTAAERLCSRALGLLEELRPEDNNIVRAWRECGLNAANAADTQALVQLRREYCDRKDCLRCRFGYEYLRQRPATATTTATTP